MKIKYLDHFNIRAPKEKLEQVKKFYNEVLGFEEGYRPKLVGPGLWLYAADEAIVHLSEDEGRTEKNEDCLDHIAMRCEGLNGFVENLKAVPLPYRSAYIPEIDLTQLFFKDPAGVTIELNFKGEKLLAE